MDKNKLRQYRNIQREIQEVRERIEKAKEKLSEMDGEYMAADVVSGGYGGTQHFRIEGFPCPEYERLKSRLYMRRLRLEKLEVELHGLAEEVEEFIASVDDSRMRRILSFRYMDGMGWHDVARSMGNGTNADAVRMEHERFMKKLKGKLGIE